MLRDGFYRTQVVGPFGSSVGVLVLDKNKVRGGDELFIYEGELNQSGTGQGATVVSAEVSAQIYVETHAQRQQIFRVNCEGSAQDRSFRITGKFAATNEIIQMSGQYIAPLGF
ncbi:hypothetical protein CAL26_05115 [Bordetella genomosp. 9]|uniref:Uncharacterized protein n=1 Tax=Bordetella genomosp. 9 TaxID=1416803 RepID=A0A261RNR7_9BORD|nr:hypothetical protein [Bordetella genomosp. 9]OZI26704.1 hypothetical protein CAL26_05115 [Bordetella genomosp. 9]